MKCIFFSPVVTVEDGEFSIQLLLLCYLHGILLPINGVLRARASVVAPVQVELHGLVAGGQAST